MTVADIIGLPPELLLYIIALGTPLLIIAYILFQDIRDATKSTVLFFTSEKEAELLNKKVEDGMIRVGKKHYDVDNEEPPMLKGQGMLLKTFRPLHVVKWDMAIPLKFTRGGMRLISGTNLKNLLENKTLDKLLEPKGQDKMMLLWLVLGLVLGGVMGYFVAKGM